MDAIRFKNIKLLKQRHLWRLGLDYGEWMTMGQVLRNLREIESGLAYEGRMFASEMDKELDRKKNE